MAQRLDGPNKTIETNDLRGILSIAFHIPTAHDLRVLELAHELVRVQK